jgi:ankyrin repeat protein
MVKLLLEKGADLESKDTRGRTLLSLASENGCEMVVKLLREKGADNSRMAGPEVYRCLFRFSDCNLLP